VFPGSTRGGTLESHTASSRQQPFLKTDRWQARVSTAAVQALVAASRQATANGQHFVITNPSDVLTDMCADLGLGSWLDDWSDQ
jgi:hypothetical protein